MVFEEGIVEDFQSDKLRQLAGLIRDSLGKKGAISVGDLLGKIEDEQLKSRVSCWVMDARFQEENLEKAMGDCIREVRKSRIKRDREMLAQKIKTKGVDQTSLLKQLQHLIEQERNL
jgi:hypothetical protein